ncbi:hypothetical protein [Rhizobium viscosum]|uniref:hypothetical protein n=1 Tax=Rhizobium viscosum TaxID=1673 RepID=UPI00178B9A5B|nr:hypothetical protein [Rhizobium viscosum]
MPTTMEGNAQLREILRRLSRVVCNAQSFFHFVLVSYAPPLFSAGRAVDIVKPFERGLDVSARQASRLKDFH